VASKRNFGSNFSEEFFISRGYTKNASGGYDPPPFKHKVFKPGEDVPDKEVVVITPDFQYTPKTEWFIPYNVPSKKNSRRNFVKNGKQISIPSKIHAAYVAATKNYWVAFGKEFRNSIHLLNLEYPLRVCFKFKRDSKRRFDYCNAAQTAEDLMTEYKWMPDDSAEYLIPVFESYEIDRLNPGVIIKILI
jgi:hypothetical protein